MAWSTRFTEMFGVTYPVALAPMGGSAGGALAAAVSNAGGLGLLGGGDGDPKWLEPELQILAGSTDKPWGVGLLSWAVAPATVERVSDPAARGDAVVRDHGRAHRAGPSARDHADFAGHQLG